MSCSHARARPAPADFLGHLVLRQIEWAVRHYPGSAQEQRFLAIGRTVLEDIRATNRP